jgi:dienelactone hydrolase
VGERAVQAEQDRYERVSDEVMALYVAGRYPEALAVIDRHAAEVPLHRSDLAHTAACLHTLRGEPHAALQVLTDAATDGAWWHPRLLLEDDDLAALARLDGFVELVEQARSRCAAAETAAALPPTVVRPRASPRGVLVVLHGAGQDAVRTVPRWASAAADGFVVVGVESSQLSTPTYRSWPDQDVASRDVAAALATLRPGERSLPVVAAGFSAGARAAMLWALRGDPCPVAGFVAVAPAVWPDQVVAPAHRPPGLVLIGAEDDLVRDVAAAVGELPGVRLEVLPQLAHAYPDDFVDRLGAELRRLR